MISTVEEREDLRFIICDNIWDLTIKIFIIMIIITKSKSYLIELIWVFGVVTYTSKTQGLLIESLLKKLRS